MNKIPIRITFWENVKWVIHNKFKTTPHNFLNRTMYKQYCERGNLTLDTIQKFANLLDIDDYSILFDSLEG